MKPFSAPQTALGDLDAEAVARLITTASDVTLVVDEAGVIRDLAVSIEGLVTALPLGQWVGKRWSQIVTTESRPKVEALLADAHSHRQCRWRHLNHPALEGSDLPILYAAQRIDPSGPIIAFGRDLRAEADLQQRLVEAQQSLERDYARIRQVQTRYGLLFRTATDAMMVVQPRTQRVVEANPAARRLFGNGEGEFRLARLFDADSARSIGRLIAGVQASGRPDDVHARLARGGLAVTVSVSLFREDGEVSCLVCVTVPGGVPDEGAAKLNAKLLKLMENAPDAFVVTADDGRIVTANAAFLALVEAPTEAQVSGQRIERWFGRGGMDMNVLTANLRQHGSVRLFATTLRPDIGEPTAVEISAVTVMNGSGPCFGFAIRDVGRRLTLETAPRGALPRSLEHLKELIGSVALKDLVREATDVIERLCIEAALELAGDNRASAAEMLGLSRQSLYVKLRRYGLGDAAPEGAD